MFVSLNTNGFSQLIGESQPEGRTISEGRTITVRESMTKRPRLNPVTYLTEQKSMKLFLQTAAVFVVAVSLAFAGDPVPKEVGSVDWQRDFSAAKQSAAQSGKPLMMFFQEIPG